jgi:serine/threonine-protein kinase HipA
MDFPVRAVVLNVLIGNGDAHAKNFSLLHDPIGALGFAPLYDLMSTLYYGDDRLAMYIDGIQKTRRVTANRILNETARWGMSRRRAAEIIADIMERIPVAVVQAQAETSALPAEISTIIDTQLARLRSDFRAEHAP